MKSDSLTDPPGVPHRPPVPGKAVLEEIIRREIVQHGSIPFTRFMELALYHPQHGYYSSGRARIGRDGDFFTNVSVGPIFGKLLAAQFAEVWDKLGRPAEFTIVEQGAHDGQFAADVLEALGSGDCFRSLHYLIVEPFPFWRERQQHKLANFQANVSWRESIGQLEPFSGVHFSNELFDALPVQLFNGANELLVAIDGDRFVFCCGGLRSSPFGKPPTVIDRRYSREVNDAARRLMRDIVGRLARGVILTIDYGFTREEFAVDSRDTLQVRARHRKLASPFEQLGHADISADVNWTDLAEAAQSAGASVAGFTDQHHFLTAVLTRLLPAPGSLSAAEKRALQTLLHPEMLGRSFQVLALAKNFPGSLTGFHFARRPLLVSEPAT